MNSASSGESTASRGSSLSVGSGRWKDLREWIELLTIHGQLLTVKEMVDADEELSAITLMGSRSPSSPAFLFENIEGNKSGARVLSNMLGASAERYALALGLDPKSSMRELIGATRVILKQRIPPIHVPKDKAPVNEIVLTGDEVDLTQLPVPKFWPHDGGRFIGTGTITLTSDPKSGRINVGAYRHELHSANRVGLNCIPGRHGILDCEARWAKGEPCEIVAAYGIDPVMLIAGSQRMRYEESELDFAGGLLGHPIELTEAEVVSLPIPARAEIVIEGLAFPGDLEMEGPLGEFHGFYGGVRSPKPVIQVKAIHHRRSPILTASLMTNHPSCEMGYNTIIRSAQIYESLEQNGVSGIRGVYVHPAAACGTCMAIVSVKQMHPGHAAQVLTLTAGCSSAAYLKWVIVVDDDVDPTDFDQVIWAMSTRCNPCEDLDILRNTWTFRADASVAPDSRPHGSKVLVNACTPYRYIKQAPKRTRIRPSIYSKIAQRWSQLGLEGEAPALSSSYVAIDEPEPEV